LTCATAITEKNGGIITSSSGLSTAMHTWGQPAEWCDYSGTVNGQRVGIVLKADPAVGRGRLCPVSS